MSELDESPFVGLPPFSVEHAPYFFGRTDDSITIVENLLARPITVLYGASGTGKSSVLNVGIPVVLSRFGDFRLVARNVWHDPGKLTSWLDEVTAKADDNRPLILIFDQFEEYFLYRTPDVSGEFEQSLVLLLARRDIEVHLLLTLRSDALHLLDGMRLRFYSIMENTVELDHLDEAEVREAIEGPIRVYNQSRLARDQVVLGAGFTDYFIDQLTGSMAALSQYKPQASSTHPIELPFLQLAMLRLWRRLPAEKGDEPRKITCDLMLTEGGVDGVVGAHVKEKLDSLTDKERNLASQIFHYLVMPSGGKFAHSPSDLAELASERAGQQFGDAEVRDLLDKLAEGDARILRETGGRFELFHDVLARPILNWRAEYRKNAYLDEAPFGYLIDIFSGKRMSLRGSGMLVGRGSEDDDGSKPLSLSPVSRNHVLVMRDGQILDLRSRFGTTINAAPIHFGQTDAVLHDGDIIGLANTTAVVYRTALIDDTRAGNPPVIVGIPAPSNWGLLIDGTSRRFFWLAAPAIDLGIGASGIIFGDEGKIAEPFARLKVTKAVWLVALTDSLEVMERTDSYNDNPWKLKLNEEFEIDLMDLQDRRPEIISAEGAYRSVFRISGKSFEIILNYRLR